MASSRKFVRVVAQRLLQLADAAHPQLDVGRPVRVVERAAGRLDRPAHVVGARIGRDAEHLLGGWVDGLERARAAGDELAVDEQLTLAIGEDSHPNSCVRITGQLSDCLTSNHSRSLGHAEARPTQFTCALASCCRVVG